MTLLAPPPSVAQPSPAPAAAAAPTPPSDVAFGTLLNGVSWETYVRLRDETDAAKQFVYMTYLDGDLYIMPPLPDHETWKSILGRMVELMTLELGIPIRSLGSTTWRRQQRRGGLEADECYYVQNEPSVRGKREIDLAVTPPPDLAIEAELTNAPIDKMTVYSRLRVPEVWRYDGARLTVLAITEADGETTYRPIETSQAFPFLKPASLEAFLARVYEVDETTLLLEFRDWVNANLKKR